MRGGWIHVIAGCMYSGKTAELVRLLHRAEIAGRRTLLIRPALDDRDPDGVARSRAGTSYPSRTVSGAADIAPLVSSTRAVVVGIEETQFFDATLVAVVEGLAAEGRDVVLSGLDTDFLARPFGAMPTLLAIADQVTKLTAICSVCGEEATRSQRLVGGRPAHATDPLILTGGFEQDEPVSETYEARCRAHHIVPEGDGNRD